MLKTLLNKLVMVIYFIVSALILEAVTFSFLGLGSWPEYSGLNFAIISFIAILVFAVPNYTAQYVIYTMILGLQTILIYVNYSLFMIYGDFFSFDMIRLVAEAGAAITTNFVYISVILQLVAVFIAIAIVGFILLKLCKKDAIRIKQHFSVFAVIVLIVCECFSLGYITNKRTEIITNSKINDSNYIYSDTFLLNSTILKYSSYQKFGTYGYFTNLLLNTFDKYNKAIEDATIDYFNSGNMYDGTSIDAEGNVVSNKVFGADRGNNVIVIMMESLEWFGFGDGNYDYSVQNLSNELTPNVYDLIYGNYTADDSDSIIATNFFAKSKTNISEGFGLLGHYPVGQSLPSFAGNSYKKATNAFGYTIPSVLKSMGYTTSYVHSHNSGFYDRDKTHGNLGFENVVGKENVMKDGERVYDDVKFYHWAAEGDFVTNTMDTLIPKTYNEKPFYSFFLNVSSHGPYKYDKNDADCIRFENYVKYGADDCERDENGNYKLINKNPTLSDWYQNVLDNYFDTDPALCNELLYWQCGVCGLDEAIGLMINKLIEYGIYDKTTMLLYSDHYSYYEQMSQRIKGFELEDFSSQELNTIPMILSSPGVKKLNKTLPAEEQFLVTDRFCSAYDVIPTLLDLLGIKFNENFYLGKSIFAPVDYVYEVGEDTREMTIYYSNTGGIFSNDIYTYNLQSFTVTDKDVNKDEIIEMFKSEVSKTLVKLNYLSLLDNYRVFNKISTTFEKT